ncbi:MAG: phenylalanine--tRNA ligase subunit beta [Tannerella sp.]|jgi:phenylalanyl-tRNA synthetase beta chain|nr:phenylalanine--tRNA ligase subunit beta [Tannerella sp.]
MNISYNWLKEYVSFDMTAGELSSALTSIGLETGKVEKIQTVKGGLERLVTGEVLTCTAHPDSDHLHVTTVNIGEGEPLQIVCGAPNVSQGQKVIVATIGTTLYNGDNEFKIKRSKIRGVESFGMICAEDEIGIGNDHSGIIVLPADTKVGMLAKDYYKIEDDYVLEVDITPNRVDATSHIGVARDLTAFLKQNGKEANLKFPAIEGFKIDDDSQAITVEKINHDGCIRYSGVTIKGVTVKESPDWIKKRLIAIGLRPINNIVDITNYILYEIGQPLHAFDADKIKGNKVIVDTMPEGTRFVTLDGVERTLTKQDLMICSEREPMCIGGVFGGLGSGVTENTTNIFLESACFNPSWIRKTARRFGLSTDASFRFERGLDPNQTIFVLKRAALLIQEIAGGKITGDIQDIYPNKIEPFNVDVTFSKINSLIGKEISAKKIKDILNFLDVEIVMETKESLSLKVPVYRYDVRRDVDVIEEILRIYGYNNVEIYDHVNSTLGYQTLTDKSYKLENIISEQLCGEGFNEVLNNSLTKSAYYEGLSSFPAVKCVTLMNPLSNDLNVMRQTLLFGGLQNVEFNIKHKNKNIHFFEFGNCYTLNKEKKDEATAVSAYREDYKLGLWISGNKIENNWMHVNEKTSIYELKAYVENILIRLGLNIEKLVYTDFSNDIFVSGMKIALPTGRNLGEYGIINRKILKMMDIDNEVYFAELSWNALMKDVFKLWIKYRDIPKIPEIKRDLALLINNEVKFADIKKTALESESKLLKNIVLFDVYEGKNLPEGKKSYAVSFYIQDEEKTLNDKQIDNIMQKIQKNLRDKLGASIR